MSVRNGMDRPWTKVIHPSSYALDTFCGCRTGMLPPFMGASLPTIAAISLTTESANSRRQVVEYRTQGKAKYPRNTCRTMGSEQFLMPLASHGGILAKVANHKSTHTRRLGLTKPSNCLKLSANMQPFKQTEGATLKEQLRPPRDSKPHPAHNQLLLPVSYIRRRSGYCTMYGIHMPHQPNSG